MATVRMEKVAALIQRELAIIFQQHMNSHFSGTMITVTNVRMSPDMGIAKAYLSFFPVEKRDASLQEVNTKKLLVRKWLGEKVGKQLRIVPELHFFVDDSLDYYEEIDKLLKKK
jgi:ribosome-binding factor A